MNPLPCLTCAILTALILVPSRELALQTAQIAKELGKDMNIQVRSPYPALAMARLPSLQD